MDATPSLLITVCFPDTPDLLIFAPTSFNPHNDMELEVKDSNGNLLKDGDSVTLIKDLKVRGSSAVLKRGTKVKNIRLTDDPEEVEGKIEGSMMVLKACFLKKA